MFQKRRHYSSSFVEEVDLLQDVITDEDREKAESLGLITIEEYEADVASGKLL